MLGTVVEFHVPAVPAGAKLADLHTSRLAQPAPKDWGTSRHGDGNQSCHDIFWVSHPTKNALFRQGK